MDPKPGESVYDPTCGSGGLLLNCALHLKEQGKEYRNLKLYGQEINLLTSSMARMNMFLHGMEDFKIVRGNTLEEPAFMQDDSLQTFNVILANPPYSIKSWNREKFMKDPYGRNIWGTPSQGCADYAFQQHIQKSLDGKNGRCAILWPHGILFRDKEAELRKKMLATDQVEAVIGLGQNLFYNSPMEAMILVCNTNKPKNKKKKVLFINAKDDIIENKGQAYLTEKHIDKIFKAYKDFKDIPHYAKVATIEEIMSFDGNMNINFYVKRLSNEKDNQSSQDYYKQWLSSKKELSISMESLLEVLGKNK
jgi:type I restriction enzyme M protein